MNYQLGDDKSEWFRVRRQISKKEEYMQADGSWGPWRTAKRFKTMDAASTFAELHTSERFGLYSYEN